MSCKDANERLKQNTRVITKGESIHPVHAQVPGGNGIETGKAMYNRFFPHGKKP